MMSVRGVSRHCLDEALTGHPGVSVAIVGGPRSVTLSGRPAELKAVRGSSEKRAEAQRAAVERKEKGGAPVELICEFLDVTAPFHTPLMAEALRAVERWAAQCPGLPGNTSQLAAHVLTEAFDWDQAVDAVAGDVDFIVSLGPGTALGRMLASAVEGRGVGLVDASSADARDTLRTPGAKMERGTDYERFSPTLAEVNGRTVVQTKFTQLTGRAPILLAGMTPTTTEPDIVAAAANAGYWVELAGGGQVTEEIIVSHLGELREKLRPGRTAQFNAMFMDRYLWNLQFGAQHVVTRERESGAPLDGVVISAGIPELEEARDLVESLRASGLTYVAFKPGTVDQIRQALAIARALPTTPIILMVEDGHAGGHHSWEDLAYLLQSTYREIREQDNTVLVVGGGLGVPERAARFITGDWALDFGRVRMPVDGVMIGTSAMTAKEAHTNPDVKQLLVDTPGVSAEHNEGWVGAGEVAGGVTSGLSHHRADMYEIDNAAAAAARLVAAASADPQLRRERRADIIAAINRTAKPYFGELADMTYAEVISRFVQLCYPFNDVSWQQRFLELCQRFEARLCAQDHGPVATMFSSLADVADAPAAGEKLVAAFPAAEDVTLTTFDVSWFIEMCRRCPKPVPFVPVIDEDILRSWGTDGLWQSHDPRYRADQVRIIPGPVSVAAITTVDEPIADILARYEDRMIDAVGTHSGQAERAPRRYSRLAATREEFTRAVPHISWHGHLMDNPAHVLSGVQIVDTEVGVDLVVDLDTAWDGTEAVQHAVREIRIPLILGEETTTGALPVVDDSRLPASVFALLAATAGVGSTTITGTAIERLPEIVASADSEFGEAHLDVALTADLGSLHAGVTASEVEGELTLAPMVPSAVLGLCWPTIYAALGSAQKEGFPVIEGLLNAVHLDHTEDLDVDRLRGFSTLHARSRCSGISESASGRIVVVETELSLPEDSGRIVGSFTERFAIRGRVHGRQLPEEPDYAGGLERKDDVDATPRSVLRKLTVTAPRDMTAFAMVSGDFNPIHTSYRAARVAGMDAPLVHGMWLCAAAQHAVSATDDTGEYWHIEGWTYRMYGMVALGDAVEITVERVARRRGGGLVLEVGCRVDGEVVAQATTAVRPPVTAYVYPGQGVQKQGMALDDRASSAAVREVWERADKHTRTALGFSILAIVRDNPTEITACGVTYRHPDGVLFLTQFTQVALATVAWAQTALLKENNVLVAGSYLAGHSLGEYNALAAYGQIFPLETVLEIVFHHGSTMHDLVPRDDAGRSDYRMAALRPNQFGVGAAEVADYVAGVAEATGEFLEIVNFNLAGAQYSVAGSVRGIEALVADSARRAEEYGGKRPCMMVPGVDVPFHSTRLRAGVPEFAATLDELLPEKINVDVLEHRYIPNLVARPFELTADFLRAILEVAPSQYVADLVERWERIDVAAERESIARGLLIELLAWQFASPVRWIETQEFLFAQAGVEQVTEIGLGHAPTLANLAQRTLKLPDFAERSVNVFNVERDRAVVFHEDVRDVASAHVGAKPVVNPMADGADSAAQAAPRPEALETPSAAPPAAQGESEARPDATAAVEGGAAGQPGTPASAGTQPAAEVEFTASDATAFLLAFATRMRLEQIGQADTVETLTGGVSSKRNQVLMDMSSELSLNAIDGAAESTMGELFATVDAAAHHYQPFGPVLSEVVTETLRRLFGAAGVGASRIAERLRASWQLGAGWAAWTACALVLATREGKSVRGGDLATLSTTATTTAEVDALIDAAVELAGAHLGVSVAKPHAAAAAGPQVSSAALDELREELSGALIANAQELITRLSGPAEKPTDTPAEDSDLHDLIAGELGSRWPELVAETFDEARAVELNDRWATACEDLATIAAGGELPQTVSFTATGAEVAGRHAGTPRGRRTRRSAKGCSMRPQRPSIPNQASSAGRSPWSPVLPPTRSPARSPGSFWPVAPPPSRPRHGSGRPGCWKPARSTASRPAATPPSGWCRPTWPPSATSISSSSGSAPSKSRRSAPRPRWSSPRLLRTFSSPSPRRRRPGPWIRPGRRLKTRRA